MLAVAEFPVGTDHLRLDGVTANSPTPADIDQNGGPIDLVIQVSNGSVTPLNTGSGREPDRARLARGVLPPQLAQNCAKGGGGVRGEGGGWPRPRRMHSPHSMPSSKPGASKYDKAVECLDQGSRRAARLLRLPGRALEASAHDQCHRKLVRDGTPPNRTLQGMSLEQPRSP